MLCETILVRKNRIVKQICQDMKTGNSVIITSVSIRKPKGSLTPIPPGVGIKR